MDATRTTLRTPRPMTRRIALTALGIRRRGPSRSDLEASVAGRLVVVTGASSGIGRATALALAACGARLILVSRGSTPERAAALEAVADACRSLGAEVQTQQLDLRDADAASDASRDILARRGVPDVVVLCAGHSIKRSVFDSSERAHDVRRTVDGNYTGHAALLLPWLPRMQPGAIVVAVSSASAEIPAPGFAAYGASKAALDHWMRAIAPELAAHGIAASVVRPALVDTPMVRRVMLGDAPAPPLALTAREAAAQVCLAIAHPRIVIEPWWATAAAVLLAVAPSAGIAIGRRIQEVTR